MGSTEQRESWQAIAARKQTERDKKIPSEWKIPDSLLPTPDVDDVSKFPETSGLFTARELELTGVSASAVVKKITSGEWTSEEVTTAICKRAAVAQQLVNCVTEICFDDAIARAKKLDDKFRKDGPVGPLHGLPISLKDQFNIPGLDSTIGYISRVVKPASRHSTLVEILLEAGAIVYTKTNVPATLMSGETVNNVFGRTVNPFNRKLSPGGSSGGESALISLKGSYLGVGTDIGGSIRHPCHKTGLYGLRPSHGRVSYQDVENIYVGQEAIRSTAGPMCRDPEDIRLFMSTVLARKPWLRDPQLLPIPWREEEEVLPKILCFGLATGDGHISGTPPLCRAVEIVRKKLVDAGHKVIEYTPSEMPEAHEIVFKMWSADAGQEFLRDLKGEPPEEKMTSWLQSSDSGPKPTVADTWENQNRRTLLAQRWLERWESSVNETGTSRPIDGLIVPSTPWPAGPHGEHPAVFNTLSPALDLTTGAFPVTKVDIEKDVIPENWQPLSEDDQKVADLYRPENHKNSPIGLQVIARRLEEEKVVAMLKLLNDVVGVEC